MDVVNMAPPIKRRKLLSPAQHQTQHSAPFFHGVEHIESAAPPRRIDEVHLQIRRESVYNDGEQLRLRRRQGTAILPNILSTNSNADVVVAVTAKVDALGSTTALATAAVTVGLPDVPSLLSTSSTTSVISDDPVESSSSASPSSSAVPSTRDDPSPGSTTSSSSAPTSTSVLSSSSTTSSTTSNIESNARSSTESSVNSSTNESSTVASSTNESKINQSSTKESSTAASSTIASSTAESSSSSVSNGLRPDYTALSSSSSTTDNDSLSRSQSQTQSEYPESGTGSLVAPASTTGNGSSVTLASTSGTAPVQSSTSSSSGSDFESSTSSNSSMVVSTAQDSQSRTSQIVIPGTVSGFTSQTGSALSSNSMNLTTSASTSSSSSTYISSGSTYVSVVAINIDSSTTRTGLKTADTTSSVDFGALFLATQSNGEVTTITRSSESFTTTLSDGQTATVSPSATSRTSSRAASSSASETSARGSVTTISSDRSTFISTVFSTDPTTSTKASPEYTPVSSDESDGTGLVGAAGDGATATSNGITSTSAASSNDSDDDAVAPAGTIAGGVVGGAAGLALVLAIVLLFMRRYKKRALLGHRALPANAAGASAGSAGGSSSGGAGMAERAGLMGFAGAVPALFKHQKRSQNTVPETGERGFQRVAGRKLPSAYSEGMTGPTHKPMSPPPTMPLVSPEGHDGNLSSHSFYRDSDGFYGGDGSLSAPDPFSDNNIAAGAVGNEAAEHLIMSPGPQRRPTIHNRKSNVHSPSVATSGTPSWTPGSAAPFVRSETPVSLDGSRNSRFTEEV